MKHGIVGVGKYCTYLYIQYTVKFRFYVIFCQGPKIHKIETYIKLKLSFEEHLHGFIALESK